LFVGPDQKTHFSSWKEVYGPHEILATNQSSAFAIFDFNLASEPDNPIRGYGPVKQDATSPACCQTREHVQQVSFPEIIKQFNGELKATILLRIRFCLSFTTDIDAHRHSRVFFYIQSRTNQGLSIVSGSIKH
jgi:hypothetical protein